MEVTKENFDEAFEVVKEAVNECDIMAFDTEFTGFSISIEDRGHDYDSIEDRYRGSFILKQNNLIIIINN